MGPGIKCQEKPPVTDATGSCGDGECENNTFGKSLVQPPEASGCLKGTEEGLVCRMRRLWDSPPIPDAVCGMRAYRWQGFCRQSQIGQVDLKLRLEKLDVAMVPGAAGAGERPSPRQPQESKEDREERVLAMLGIVGTILNLLVIIFVYVYTTI
uniref:Uncharacterized protein n=1 Tax=Sphaerodactylus townsendi TaxID=933632 RepID=A0ACB8FFF7_9SAUR